MAPFQFAYCTKWPYVKVFAAEEMVSLELICLQQPFTPCIFLLFCTSAVQGRDTLGVVSVRVCHCIVSHVGIVTPSFLYAAQYQVTRVFNESA